MKKALLALGAAAVALSAAPADARHRHHARTLVCNTHRHCVAVKHVKAKRYAVGYAFGPKFVYTPVAAIPERIVTRYSLRPTNRYVYQNGYVYVVNPNTYRVVRVIMVP